MTQDHRVDGRAEVVDIGNQEVLDSSFHKEAQHAGTLERGEQVSMTRSVVARPLIATNEQTSITVQPQRDRLLKR